MTQPHDTQHYDTYCSQHNDTRCNYIEHKRYDTQPNDDTKPYERQCIYTQYIINTQHNDTKECATSITKLEPINTQHNNLLFSLCSVRF